MTRRSLFKRTATAGATVAITVGGVERFVPAYSPLGRAQALSKSGAFLIGVSGIAGLLVGAGYMLGSGDGSADAINEARANELHDRIWLDGNEMQMTQTPMLESLSGDVTMLRQICRSDAAFALMNAASDSKSEADATADGKAAVEDAVAKVEANFFDAWTSQLTKLGNRASLVNNEDPLNRLDVFQWIGSSVQPNYFETLDPDHADTGYSTATATLVNGQTHSVDVVTGEYSETGDLNAQHLLIPWSDSTSASNLSKTQDYGSHYAIWSDDGQSWTNGLSPHWGVNILDRQSGDTVPALDATDWWQIHNDLVTLLEEEKTNVETMVSTFYQEALNGELDLHEMASASAILEAADTLDNWKQAAGAYRAMVMPEAEDPAVIELENGVQLEGLLFWSDPDPDNGLPVGDLTNPDNTIGRIYMAAEIRSVPETPESETYDVTVTVVDDDTDATALEGISITVKGTDATATTDANGESTLSLPEGPRTLYLSGTDSGGTSHETGQTLEISSENTSAEIVHDGGDRTSVQADPFADETLTQENVGDVVMPYLTDPFTLLGIDGRPDATNLMFEEPTRVEPDDDFQTQVDNSKRAAEQEEETRTETTKIVIEETGDGPGPIFGGDFLEGGGGLLGLGIIGVVILAVIGIVTDAIPGLGN
ncbi:hypothetical protein [Natrinema sp. DC36]|uniref:hypothetical protein n=1 Tax=Natrinema sp. DC36 TaxID=2878680 RepID=UPI001CF01842|nr:hypothetical protein [Natrinema sp. DC36]